MAQDVADLLLAHACARKETGCRGWCDAEITEPRSKESLGCARGCGGRAGRQMKTWGPTREGYEVAVVVHNVLAHDVQPVLQQTVEIARKQT